MLDLGGVGINLPNSDKSCGPRKYNQSLSNHRAEEDAAALGTPKATTAKMHGTSSWTCIHPTTPLTVESSQSLQDDLDDLYDSDVEGGGESSIGSVEIKCHTPELGQNSCNSIDAYTIQSECTNTNQKIMWFRPREGVFVWVIPEELLFYIGLRLGWQKSAFCCEVSKKWCATLRGDAIWSAFLDQRQFEHPSPPTASTPKPQVVSFPSCDASEPS